jgi:predicted transcriptional regulator
VYTGYVYLVDKENNVRWRGSGKATEGEVQSMLNCVDMLLAEQQVEQILQNPNQLRKAEGKKK